MQFAPVMPSRYMPELDTGRYHLVNSFTVNVLDEKTIKTLFHWAASREHTLILDNGAYELGEGQVDRLFEVAKEVYPDIIVCPDTVQDIAKTIDMMERYFPHCLNFAERGHVMLVPQGENPTEWFECLEIMLEYCQRVHSVRPYIGVPKYLERFGRIQILAHLSTIVPLDRVHLLGIYQSFDEFVEAAAWFPDLMGCDSTWTFAHTMAFPSWLVPLTGGDKYGIGDWNIELTVQQLIAAKINIATCFAVLDRPRLSKLSI